VEVFRKLGTFPPVITRIAWEVLEGRRSWRGRDRGTPAWSCAITADGAGVRVVLSQFVVPKMGALPPLPYSHAANH
jgi:hypothetical protein